MTNRIVLVFALGALCAAVPVAAVSREDLTDVVRAVAHEEWPNGQTPEGSGFVVDSSGLILTAAHVIVGCNAVDIVAHRHGATRTERAQIVAKDQQADVALLFSSKLGTSLFADFSHELPERYDRVSIPMLTPAGGRLNVIHGRALGLATIPGAGTLFTVAAKLPPGSSGAPVLDSQGNVVAYIVGRLQDKTDVGLAVPVRDIDELLQEYVDGPIYSTRVSDFVEFMENLFDYRQWNEPGRRDLNDLTVSVRCV